MTKRKLIMTGFAALSLSVVFPMAVSHAQMRGAGDDMLDHRVRSAPSSPVFDRQAPAAPVQAIETDLQAAQVIEGWHADSQEAARAIIEQYGEPDEVRRQQLVWNDNGPWTRTVVVNEQDSTRGVLRQTVEYEVSPERIGDLSEFSDKLNVNRARGELTAHGDSEETNLLSINLAHQIHEGEIDAAEAQERYSLAMEGDGYTELRDGFVFDVPSRPDVQFGVPTRPRSDVEVEERDDPEGGIE